MAFSKELQQKLEYWEQIYNGLDKPVPFKNGLDVFPVKVKDYYKFYNCFGCLTMDKTMKFDYDENGDIRLDPFGEPIKVTNIKGLGQSYLAYLIDMMKDDRMGQQVTMQVMQLFELVFHIPRGMYCPKCHKEISYEKFLDGIEEYVDNEVSNAEKEYSEAVLSHFKNGDNEDIDISEEQLQIPKELKLKIAQKARYDFLQNVMKCPDCGETMRDVFSIKEENGNCCFVIKDVEINSGDFDELKALIPRQNILDYDGDRYLDPELKEELDLKAQLQNKDYTSPTLEKQLVCVGISTGYTLDYLHEVTMRKLSMMLRLIDRKEMYYAQMQGAMSGMVSFKAGQEPKHWIFTDDSRNIAKELMDLENFEKKFDMVT